MSEPRTDEATAPEESEPKLRLGGMALANGLLIHGPTHWAAAVRTPSGELRSASGPKPTISRSGPGGAPGIRGVARLAEAFAVIPIVRARLPEARLPFEQPRALAAVAGASLAGRLIRRGGKGTLGREAAVAVLGLAPALLTLRLGEVAQYHGAEHKTIGAYEDDADAAEATKEHDRCGSNLVAPMIATTVAGNVALRRAGVQGAVAEAAASLGGVAVAVEVFAWSERNSSTALAKALRRPGHELQRAIGTREPNADQLAVAKAALTELLRAEGAAEPGPAAEPAEDQAS